MTNFYIAVTLNMIFEKLGCDPEERAQRIRELLDNNDAMLNGPQDPRNQSRTGF